jgi:4-diphosphocytidyl-2-C-methyl-D-erythritol kinase
MDALTIQATGKVNLFLETRGRRPDGYCEIRSVVAPVSLFDTLEIEVWAQERIETTMTLADDALLEAVPTVSPEENLATRAAWALKKESGCRGGARIYVRKQIPIGGGMGGGSADAAAVLTGLNALWKTGLDRRRLMAVGAALGCDIPALVHGGWVRMEGRGERIAPLAEDGARPTENIWIVLANPGFCVSTRDVYQRHDKAGLTLPAIPYTDAVRVFLRGTATEMGGALFNSLQPVVFEKYPLVAMTAERLARAGATGVLLCGSGATVMGLARDQEHARAIARDTSAAGEFPLWVRVAHLLPDGVMVAHGPLEARV